MKLCVVKGKIKGNTAEETCPEPGSKSVKAEPNKTPNCQFPELLVNQYPLSATFGAWRMEQDVLVLQPEQCQGNRRNYLVTVSGVHGEDRSTHRIHHVYGSRIGALGKHWGIIIHINHCNTDMGGCLENKMVPCALEYSQNLI